MIKRYTICMKSIAVSSNKQTFNISIRDVADQSVANEIFKFHEYRRAEEIIKNAQFPILDVGAHVGFFTLWARSFNANVQIICIEPHPDNVTALGQHIAENKISNVEIVKGALTAESGKRNLEVSRDTHNHKIIGEPSNKSIVVQGYSLLQIVKKYSVDRFSLVKMDIEGGEYELFNAWSETEYQKIGAIIMEYHDIGHYNSGQIEQTLRQNGFGVQKFPSQFDSTMGFFLANNKRI